MRGDGDGDASCGDAVYAFPVSRGQARAPQMLLLMLEQKLVAIEQLVARVPGQVLILKVQEEVRNPPRNSRQHGTAAGSGFDYGSRVLIARGEVICDGKLILLDREDLC